MAEKNEDHKKRLEEFRKKEAEDLTRILSKKYNIPYIDLSRVTIDLDALKIVPEKEARRGRLAVFQKVGKKLQVALRNPELIDAKNVLQSLEREGYTYDIFLASENSLKRAWSRYKEVPEFVETKRGFIDISTERIQEFQKKVTNTKTLIEILEPFFHSKEQRHISEALEIVLAGALKLQSSDIHIEPRKDDAKMRMRLDGILHDIIDLPQNVYSLLLSRIKLISELKLNIHEKSQDGRFTIHVAGNDIEVRTSILPGPNGESIVLRILDPSTISFNLEDLGIAPYMRNIIEDELKSPNGMMLTTGPTGSGKTTTLYAFIKKKKTPDIKIITIEDPIEYHIPGVTQTQVHADKGYDFANGLRSIVRQDPDVILVGEIRDLETADIAMHAALTGHLVFSTLHTNDAAGTIPRLIDLGIKPAIIAPAINISMAQRLVRRLCDACKKKAHPTEEQITRIKRILAETPEKMPKPKEISFYEAVGCDKCNNTGYNGRIGIFEMLLVDDNVEKLILETPTHQELRAEMKRQEMPTMLQDGIIKMLQGITSLAEIERIAGTE